jgi:hypothetical protein
MFFCYFCVLEKLHRKYSQNWTKRKPNLLFSRHKDGVQSGDGGGPGADHTMGWRRSPLAAPPCGVGPWATPWHRPSAYKLPSTGKPETREPPSTESSVAATIIDPRSRGSISSSRHPAREGNHYRSPPSSPCLPLECVSSSSLDYGSIAVARWLSSRNCASWLDLVSCLSWLRSSYYNSICCVCWDPMNIEYYVKLIINLSCLCYLWSCMLFVASRCFGQVDASDSKREYLCSIVGSCL